nr:hypothetical protein Iba_chr12eCG7960 [Ipomoea batatas]
MARSTAVGTLVDGKGGGFWRDDMRCSAFDIYRYAAAFQRELRDRIESRKNRRNRGGKLRLRGVSSSPSRTSMAPSLRDGTPSSGIPLFPDGARREHRTVKGFGREARAVYNGAAKKARDAPSKGCSSGVHNDDGDFVDPSLDFINRMRQEPCCDAGQGVA